MGNGVSSDQENLPSCGKRDVRRAADRKQHDWSELAVIPETNSLLTVANSYIGASNVGPESSTGNNVARRKSSTGNDVHVDASGAESKPSTGNMYVAAEHRRTSRYIQETRYDLSLIHI